MPKMLTGNGQKGWPYIQWLLVDLFQFMEPFLRHAELGDPVCLLINYLLSIRSHAQLFLLTHICFCYN
jgi:CCR4-NOT transcription complex subunit 1